MLTEIYDELLEDVSEILIEENPGIASKDFLTKYLKRIEIESLLREDGVILEKFLTKIALPYLNKDDSEILENFLAEAVKGKAKVKKSLVKRIKAKAKRRIKARAKKITKPAMKLGKELYGLRDEMIKTKDRKELSVLRKKFWALTKGPLKKIAKKGAVTLATFGAILTTTGSIAYLKERRKMIGKKTPIERVKYEVKACDSAITAIKGEERLRAATTSPGKAKKVTEKKVQKWEKRKIRLQKKLKKMKK